MAVDDSYTKALLHFNGTDESNTFTDESGKEWTAAGNAQLDTSQKKFGTASLYLDGSGDYISTPDSDDFTFGSGDFTIDFWWRTSSSDVINTAIVGAPGNVNGYAPVLIKLLFASPNTKVYVYGSEGGSAWNIDVSSTTKLAADTDYHIAWVRNGSNFQLYINGVADSTCKVANANALLNGTRNFYIGAGVGGGEPINVPCWIDEFRVSKGIARWTENFTPPTQEYAGINTYDGSLSDSFSIDDSISAVRDPVYNKDFPESFSVDDSIVAIGLASLPESFSVDDSISVEGPLHLDDSFSVDDSISIFNSQKELSDSFSLDDSISAQKSGAKVLNLYQFNKGSEPHFYAQFSNGIVKEATNQPPTVTTGDFGAEVFSGSANQIPASWAVVKDRCIMGNGVDGFQIYPGTLNQIKQVVVYKGSAAPGAIPSIGDDYTDRLKAGGVIVLDSLGDLAVDNDCVFIRTDLPADTLAWTVSKANGTAAVAAVKYFNGTWTAVSNFTDNTADGGATLAKSGTMTWTLPTDSQPLYMYGGTGYWYQVYLSSGDLDSEVEISALTYETDWQALVNMWDGVALDAVEAQFYDDSAGVHNTFGGSSIDIDEMTSSDILLFCSADPSVSFYFDFGDTPNTTASLTVTYKYFNGSDFASLSNVTDGTEGFTKSGWITFSRPTDEQPRQYGSTYYAYWYTATVSGTLSDSVNVGITTTPYYDISEFGKGICCAAWKNRACYVFDRNPADITVTAIDEPLQLSSATNSDILYAGDGRQNAIKAMRGFYNELMVFQEEIGEEGGCITLFEGYDKDTHGKLVLSHKIGTMSNKTVDVIEGIQLAENRVGTVAVTLSHYGVFMIDGKSVADISEDIKNYFDGTKTECIRKGYENEMWLKWDSAQKLIRMGLVSGSSATAPNVFPVYDPKTREWYFDSLGQTITCMAEAKAGSGNVSVVQVGGGADGFVYQLNYGDDDVTTAIDAYVTVEFDGAGREMLLEEFILRVKAQAAAGAGNVTVTPYNNGVAGSAKTLSMAAILTGQASRRHRDNFGGVKSDHFSIKIQNNAASMSMTLLDYAVSIKELTGQ
jgi:hypothetical protein